MDIQEEFFQIVEEFCDDRCLDVKVENGANVLLSHCISGEIRDIEWNHPQKEFGISFYQAIFLRLNKIWYYISPGKSIFLPEAALLRIWASVVVLSEYETDLSFASAAVTAMFVENGIKRIMTLSTFADTGSSTSAYGLTAASSIFIIQQLIVRIYHSRFDLRERIRHLVVKYVLCVNQSTKDTERSALDGGKTRAHVQHLLKLLQAIITGFKVSQDPEIFLQRRELLLDVLIPLHLPNEMIEWRDQIPVLQMYHEDLVKCVVTLAQKSDEGYFAVTDRASDSLFTEALLQVLRHWPESFNTNTPKQVLLLHEIEILVERLDVKRLVPVHDALLDRLVKCVGTNADNIRPAQRALQFFKNNKVMSVLFPVSAEDESSGSRSYAQGLDERNHDEENDDESERFKVAKKTFQALLPSLYRGGQPSWNPTVNKMTSLALKRFMEINEVLVKSGLEEYFGRHVNGSRFTRSLRPSNSTISLDFKGNNEANDRFASPLGPACLSENASTVHSTKHGLPPKLGSKKAFDIVARMPTSLSQGSSPLSFPPTTKPRTQVDNAGPVFINSLSAHTSQHHASGSLSSNANGRMNPPLTVTGLAPWAMAKPGAHSDQPIPAMTTHQARSNLPLHTVPPSALSQAKQGPPIHFSSELNAQRVMLPLPPSNPHSTYGRPITSTVSESKQRDSMLRASMKEQDDGDENNYDRALDKDVGLTMLREYMVRLYPQIFASDGDSASLEAQGKDWCWSQAAATPSLLPNLKFHDLVFGQILGEGAFSTVKYARHITKGKAQSEWPEYGVKIIVAKKVVEFQYSLSVIREISVLQLLLHPGIARMIQAFQYHGSAYLVLEYASRGDLHSFLLKAGRELSTKHTLLRFIIGEIASAVNAIHEHGFVYNDLKPENILITELGHVKITDFGACRPFTPVAKRLVRESCQRLMDLPDGNWKVTSKDEENEMTGTWRSIFQDPRLWEENRFENNGSLGNQDSKSEGKETNDSNRNDPRRALVERCEGTPGYMPPEAFALDGSISSLGNDVLLDAWALGCVLYFCYHGKPRFYGEDSKTIMEQMQIWFEEEHQQKVSRENYTSLHHVHFSTGHSGRTGDVDNDASMGTNELNCFQQLACETLIRQLLSFRGERMSVAGVLDHPYLTTGLLPEHHEKLHSTVMQQDDGLDVFPVVYDPRSLHAIPPPRWPEVSEDGGSSESSRWARRQFSTLWAPMPHVYQVNGEDNVAPAFLSQHTIGSKGIGNSRDENDLMHSVLRMPLPIIEESDHELHCSFFSRM